MCSPSYFKKGWLIVTDREWVTVNNIAMNARKALNELDEFEDSDRSDDTDYMLDAYAECVSEFRLAIGALEDFLKVKEEEDQDEK